MPFQMFYKMDDEHGSGLLLESYEGTFGIYEASESQNGGTVYKKWCYPQRRVNGENIPSPKSIPKGIQLGNVAQAIKILSYFLEQLSGNQTSTHDSGEEPPF